MSGSGTECVPVKTGIFHNLSSEEAYDLLVNAPKNKDKLSTAPPVQPEGGTVFLYNLGENSETWVGATEETNKVRYL